MQFILLMLNSVTSLHMLKKILQMKAVPLRKTNLYRNKVF